MLARAEMGKDIKNDFELIFKPEIIFFCLRAKVMAWAESVLGLCKHGCAQCITKYRTFFVKNLAVMRKLFALQKQLGHVKDIY